MVKPRKVYPTAKIREIPKEKPDHKCIGMMDEKECDYLKKMNCRNKEVCEQETVKKLRILCGKDISIDTQEQRNGD